MMATPNKPIEIFYAEDDKGDRLLFEISLNETGLPYRLTIAEDGLKAMKILESKEYTPDIIFLDLKMPLKDGYECLQEIRKNETFKDIPVVIYTTSLLEKDIKATYNNKANLYIEKCFDTDSQT